MFVAAKIAYDGSKFYGFSKQKDYLSVVEFLEKKLATFGIFTKVMGAGRTDRGVHATGQVIKFEVPDYWDLERLLKLFNIKAYPLVAIRRIWKVTENFHPRFDAVKREYRYIFGKSRRNIWLSSYVSYEVYDSQEKIQEALEIFIGKHDFLFFSKRGSDATTSVREIYKAFLYEYQILNDKYLVAVFQANGFLYAQIRMMMGAILAYSRGEITLDDLKSQLLVQKSVYQIPSSPSGLYLSKIFY
ncbi:MULTISPECIES: tRNA pseudouridine(38-40) synthase TruA [unclassified Helicobacter]|uniref:tRNA pseudouridine(38-40) synthase TruA n=1 Tax=unclassified Helicobacter TaxID=2593540 RepID=UPI000CF12ED4|nr:MULTISPECIES: tRNA pseudouridine(38-40) synthase TruA [unclassified Helicobacter]